MNGNGGRREPRPRRASDNVRGNAHNRTETRGAKNGGRGENRSAKSVGRTEARSEAKGRRGAAENAESSNRGRSQERGSKAAGVGSHERVPRSGRSGDQTYFDRTRGGFITRPKWQPPKKPSERIPRLVCAHCGKQINDIGSAISEYRERDGAIESPVYHFECVFARIMENERLEIGERLCYIGGGRFGIVRFEQGGKRFVIKKIIEWDKTPGRAPYRQLAAEYFSRT